MAKLTKQDISVRWAETGSISAPSTSYVQAGWLAVKPPRQYLNWIENRQDNQLAYINQAGVCEWDSATEYEGGFSYVQGSDNKVYKCLSDNTNKDPTDQPANAAFWQLAFYEYASGVSIASGLTTLSNNYASGAGITDPASFRSAISCYSKTQVDAMFATGMTIKSVYASTTSSFTIASNTPIDGSPPQITEGDQILTSSITPSSSSNKVRVRLCLPYYIRESDGVVHVHRQGVANALRSIHISVGDNVAAEVSFDGAISLVVEDSPATTSAVTYEARVGYSGGGNDIVVNSQTRVPQIVTLILEEIKG